MKRKVSDLKVAELKAELEKRGLESKGLKGVLVQRLQKALEDEGGNTSEIETFGDTASPKISRRSAGRQKRATESETEQIGETSQEEEKEQVPDIQPENVAEKSDETNGVNVVEGDISAPVDDEATTIEQNEVIEQTDEVVNDIDDAVQNEDFDDATPTRDEEDDAPAPLSDQGDEYVPLEDGQMETVSAEEVPASEENIPESGNDFSDHEDPEQIEEEHEMMEEEGEDSNIDVAVEQVEEEMAENVEAESFVTAVDEQEMGAGDAEETIETEETSTVEEVVEKTENVIEAATEVEDIKTMTEEKKEAETNEKEEIVVTAEVDVLDMLDYDLEITGDQNNINTPSYDRSAKISESEAGDGKKTTKTEEATSQDGKSTSRQGSDSLKKPSSSSSDPSKSGSQSSTKSSSTPTSKDGGKSTTASKRESAGSSSTSKKEDANKNLWISGLSQTTRASELKSAFSRYGKVIGAKVVTNVKSPGSRCYGYVTMSTVEAASKCILHLNNTDMHGRMITVEIAKSDPSASSSKKQSTTSSGASTKKEASDTKTISDKSKTKDPDSKPSSSTSSRRQSSTAQSGKDVGGDKGKSESEKKPAAEFKNKEVNSTNRKADDAKKTGHSKSPARDRSRAERTSTSGPRTGDKRRTPPPPRNRSASSRTGNTGAGYNKDEPDRKRARQPDAADRKVVMDSHKGELRVNVSRTTGRYTERAARWQATNEPKPKPLLSLRRSTSPPIRRRSISPMRGSVLSRTGSARGRGGRGGRGGTGLISRQSATYEDRNTARAGNRNRPILSFNQIRAQQRDRDRSRGTGGNRGGLVRGELQADRERLRREREERDRLRLERERLEKERRQLEKDRQERARLEAERLRLEQERKRELERIEREKAEMRRLQEITRYEVEQRQRAIKRTYDDDSTSHRSNRASNRDTSFDTKRSLVSDREVRTENRRGDREDRRGYGDYSSRDTSSRNGPAQPSPPGTSSYRSNQGSYRGSGSNDRSKTNASSYDSRRTQDSHDADTRYGGVSGGTTAGRSVEKYDRRGGGDSGRAVEYSHGYDRDTSDSLPTRRRGATQSTTTRDTSGRDGRKVVRERSNEHRNATSPDFRRTGGRSGTGARVEITREQSPPVRRARRDSSPAPTRTLSTSRVSANARGASWRDSSKTTRETSRRGADDRDLREQLRDGRQESYSESSRDRGSQRNRAASHSASPPQRSSGHYQSRWPDSATDASSQQIYSMSGEPSAIPTQTGRSGSSAAWGHVQQWQQSTGQGARAWPSAAMQDPASAVTRQMLATAGYGGVPSAPAALIPAPAMLPSASQSYIPSDRQSRQSLQPGYNKLVRRY